MYFGAGKNRKGAVKRTPPKPFRLEGGVEVPSGFEPL